MTYLLGLIHCLLKPKEAWEYYLTERERFFDTVFID
jgi:hypothetical protein